MAKPDDTWWIAEKRLLGSANPSTETLVSLTKQGFSRLICLLKPGQQKANYDETKLKLLGWQIYKLPLADFTAPGLVQFKAFISYLESVPENEKVLLHCQGGKGRTGTFGAAYLMVFKALSAEIAIQQIRQAKPEAIETQAQEEALKMFEIYLKALKEDAQ